MADKMIFVEDLLKIEGLLNRKAQNNLLFKKVCAKTTKAGIQ